LHVDEENNIQVMMAVVSTEWLEQLIVKRLETKPRKCIGIYDNLADAQPSIVFPIEEIYTPILEEGVQAIHQSTPQVEPTIGLDLDLLAL
jgi:hypothetical protein